MNVETRGRLIRSQLPARHRERSIEPSGPFAAALTEARKALSGNGIVALIGKRGTGKTQLAAELLRDACAVPCRPDQEPAYRTAYMLFAEIRAAMQKASEIGLVKAFAASGLLVIDEAHERGESAWEDRTLTAIIDARYGAMLPTVLVANTQAGSLGGTLRESIVSRIGEGGRVIECDWPSFRATEDQV